MRCVISATFLLSTAASVYAGVDYTRDVQPIFASRCYACHGAQRALGGLRLDDASHAAAAKDKVIARVTSGDQAFRMPLGAVALSADQIAILNAWVASPVSRPVSSHWSFRSEEHTSELQSPCNL